MLFNLLELLHFETKERMFQKTGVKLYAKCVSHTEQGDPLKVQAVGSLCYKKMVLGRDAYGDCLNSFHLDHSTEPEALHKVSVQ